MRIPLTATLLVALLTGPAILLADDSIPARDTRSLDPHLQQLLPLLINQGVNVYNNGDPESCNRIYESTLLVIRPALAHHPRTQQAIDQGLAEARRKADPRERAAALRAILDAVRSDLAGNRIDTPRAEAPKPETPKLAGEFTMSRDEQGVLDLVNTERKKMDLPPLKPTAKLFEAARAHSENMAKKEQINHVLDGEGPGERLQKVGYRSFGWGENVAAGQRTPAEAMSSWMNSEGHRGNILNPRYGEIGIGVVTGRSGMPYWTQVFGTPAGQ